MSTVNVKWVNGLTIVGEAINDDIYFDNRYKEHTELEGTAPTEVFLMSIIGCSTMSTISLLNKNRIEFGGLGAEIEAETQSSSDTPYQFTRFRIKYNFSKIAENDYSKISDMVAASHQKYCPMIFMTQKIAPVQYEIYIDSVLAFKSENWKDKEVPVCVSEICDNYYKF